jgi:hypothetical protein
MIMSIGLDVQQIHLHVGYLVSKVYMSRPRIINDLKQRIWEEILATPLLEKWQRVFQWYAF